MTDGECYQTGNRELARFLGKNLRSVCRMIPDMKRLGVVIEDVEGQPKRRVNRWLPSQVAAYMAARQRKKWEDKKK
jgi:hypothetical protein